MFKNIKEYFVWETLVEANCFLQSVMIRYIYFVLVESDSQYHSWDSFSRLINISISSYESDLALRTILARADFVEWLHSYQLTKAELNKHFNSKTNSKNLCISTSQNSIFLKISNQFTNSKQNEEISNL